MEANNKFFSDEGVAMTNALFAVVKSVDTEEKVIEIAGELGAFLASKNISKTEAFAAIVMMFNRIVKDILNDSPDEKEGTK